jgi:hypothetical protein
MTNKIELMQEFEDLAACHGGLNLERQDDFTNESLPFPTTYFSCVTEIAWRFFANSRSKPNKTIEQLRSEIESLKNAPLFDRTTHKIVPIEPTDLMINEGEFFASNSTLCYRDMIAAAPEYQGEVK